MAAIDYRTVNRKKPDKFVFPEESDAKLSDVLVPSAEMFLFFSKPGHKITGAVFGAAQRAAFGLGRTTLAAGAGIDRWARGGGLKRGADFLTMKAPKVLGPILGAPLGLGVGAAKGAGAILKNKGAKLGERALEVGGAAAKIGQFMSKRPGLITTLAIGGGLIFGGMKGLKKEPIRLEEDIGRGGPDLSNYLKSKGGRLRPGHLGATGDLTLSLHQGR